MAKAKKEKKDAAKVTDSAYIAVVLDKSGSMASLVTDTIGGYNKFVEEQAAAAPNARFALTMFDTAVVEPYKNIKVSEVPKLTAVTYRPGGNTALLDAIGRTIKQIDELSSKPDKIVVLIMTDGQENSSHEYKKADLATLIAERTAKAWQFVFLGANMDAFAEARALGIPAGSTSSWTPTSAGTQAAYNHVSSSSASYLRGFTASVDMSQPPTVAGATQDHARRVADAVSKGQSTRSVVSDDPVGDKAKAVSRRRTKV